MQVEVNRKNKVLYALRYPLFWVLCLEGYQFFTGEAQYIGYYLLPVVFMGVLWFYWTLDYTVEVNDQEIKAYAIEAEATTINWADITSCKPGWGSCLWKFNTTNGKMGIARNLLTRDQARTIDQAIFMGLPDSLGKDIGKPRRWPLLLSLNYLVIFAMFVFLFFYKYGLP